MRVWVRGLTAGMAAVLSVAVAPLASADTGTGVSVSSVLLTQGTGTHAVSNIIISAGSSLIGLTDSVEVTARQSPGMSWFQGVSAGGSTGASCSAESSVAWACTPGSSGWRAGDLIVSVSTAKANCTAASSTSQSVCQLDTIGIYAVDVPGPGSDAQTWASGAEVEITARSAAPTTHPVTAHSSPATRTVAAAKPSPAASHSVSRSPSPSPSPSTEVPAATALTSTLERSSAPAAIDAVNTAATSSTAHTLEVAVPFVIVVLVVAFVGWRLGGRRRRDRAAGRGPGDESGE